MPAKLRFVTLTGHGPGVRIEVVDSQQGGLQSFVTTKSPFLARPTASLVAPSITRTQTKRPQSPVQSFDLGLLQLPLQFVHCFNGFHTCQRHSLLIEETL